MPIPGWGIFKNRVLGQAVGTAAGFAAADALTPPFRELIAEMEHLSGLNRRLSPADLAELVVRGVRAEGDAAGEAADQGINASRFHELFLLSGNPPGPETLLELWRRGAIAEGAVDRGIRQGRIRSEWLEALKVLREALLPLGTAAELAARGLLAEGKAARIAQGHGITGEDWAALERASRRPPPAGELLDLLNRGATSEAQVRQALTDLGMRPDWQQDYLELRKHLAPPGDLIRFAVREVYSPEVAQRFGQFEDFPPRFAQEAAKLGIDQELARNYWAAHWDLPAPGQGFQMFHRGIIDRPTLQLLLRALDVMPFWRDRLIQLAYRVPGRIDIRRMFRFGSIDRARLVRGYLDLGYKPEDAELLAVFAEREKMGAERDLSKGEVLGLYEQGALPRADAVSFLDAHGYDASEAELILKLADLRVARRQRDAVVAVVKSRYLDRELDQGEAISRLTTAGLAQEEQTRLLDLWTLEREQNPRHISEAQMRSAWKKKLVDEARYRQHLAQLGTPDDEAEILVKLYR